MRALPVNLVGTRPWRTWAGVLVFVVSTAIAAVQGWRVWRVYMAKRDIQLQLQQQAPRTDPGAARPVATDPGPNGRAYAADAANIAKLASFDVAAVLTNIEAAKVLGVRVVSIDVTARESTTRIEIESPDHQAAIQYVSVLNQAAASNRWALTRLHFLQNVSVAATIAGGEPLPLR